MPAMHTPALLNATLFYNGKLPLNWIYKEVGSSLDLGLDYVSTAVRHGTKKKHWVPKPKRDLSLEIKNQGQGDAFPCISYPVCRVLQALEIWNKYGDLYQRVF